jgi:glycerol-3-phosphate dehydrogenase
MRTLYDLIIIGGGIQGVGVAQAAAAAGYQTVLLEQEGLAAGTSSRSSKLIHGGLRYLEYGQFGLVRELLRERALLLKNAPELVRLVPFYLPIYRDSRHRPWQVGMALALYRLLGGGAYRKVPRRQWDSLDGLQRQGLQTVLQYRDAQTDDAGLTRAVWRSAEELGAELRCPASFIAAQVTEDSVQVRVEQQGRELTMQARALINAAGPWVNQALGRISPPLRPLAIDLVQGAHLVLDGPALGGVYYLEVKQDGRAVLVMPWRNRILVGTTESLYRGEPGAESPLPEEITYLEQVVRDYFPEIDWEIAWQFAGLRVLPAGAGGFSRRTRAVLLYRDKTAPRVLSIYGGKLTNYRATAAKILHRLQPLLPKRRRIADTADLRLRPEDPA